MSVNTQLVRRATVALVAGVTPFALGTVVTAAPDSAVPGDDCGWIDQAALADLPFVEAADQLSELTVFRAAIDASGLVGELEGQGPFTVFAPSNDAMNEIPQNVFDAMLNDPALLTSIVGQHIVVGQSLSADDLAEAGTVESLSGPVTVTADGDALQVNGNDVECADVATADATIFVIDGVLEPASLGGACPTGSSVPGSSTPGSSTPGSSTPAGSTPGGSVPC